MKTRILSLLIIIPSFLVLSINNKKTNGAYIIKQKMINKDTLVNDTIKSNTYHIPDSVKLTEELFVKYLINIDIKHPEIAYAIAKQESGFRSNLFKTNNNLFGMKHPGVRPTKSIGRKNGFAHFEHWKHSIEDYKLYFEYVGGHNMDKQKYLWHLKNNYATQSYVNQISKHFDNYYVIKNKIINDTIY